MPGPGAHLGQEAFTQSAPHSINPGVWLPLREVLQELDPRAEQVFDEILELAADLLDCAYAGVLFHESERYWFKSRSGQTVGDAAPSEGSLVRYTMAGTVPFIVPDATADPRFAGHPRVAGPPHIRFYFGAPLIGADGHRFGALAVMDSEPHPVPAPLVQRTLQQLARDIMREIESCSRERARAIGRATGRAIAAATSETILTVAPDWRILLWEKSHDGLIGLEGNPIGASLWSIIPGEEGSRLRAELNRVMAERAVADFDEFVQPWQRLVNFRILPLDPGGLVLICRATDRSNQIELALRASEARLHRSEVHLSRAQKMAQVGSAEVDLTSGQNYWSDQMYRIFGLPVGSAPPSPDFMTEHLVHPDDRDALRDNQQRQMRGEHAAKCEYRILRPDGDVRTLIRLGEMTFDSTGRPIRYMTTVQDVTELRDAERERDEYHRQLQHAQRLDALGTLAGGIAHDLNNTLVPVLALTRMMLKERGLDRDLRRNLEVIRSAGERARDLVRQVLTFSRKEPVQRQLINLRDVISESLKMVRVSIDPRIQVKARLMPGATAFADPGQIHQVVVNLLTNAAQAIGDRGGNIVVTLSMAASDSGAARLTVADDGPGMDERTLSRIFEPFFTTKGFGVGAGLGLSIVHGIVTNHGGRVWADSAPGNGTRISIELPLAQSNPADSAETVLA